MTRLAVEEFAAVEMRTAEVGGRPFQIMMGMMRKISVECHSH